MAIKKALNTSLGTDDTLVQEAYPRGLVSLKVGDSADRRAPGGISSSSWLYFQSGARQPLTVAPLISREPGHVDVADALGQQGAELTLPTPILGPMQPAPTVSPDGKYWWDGETWQKLPTFADAPELGVARAADPSHFGQVVAAVVLWAVLLLGIGIVALGAIALIDLLIPGHRQAGGVALVVVDIALGALVGLPAVLQSKWFARPAHSGSAYRSWMPWVLWAIVVLGIGIAGLGMVGLLDLLSPHHSKTLTAAPGVGLIGLGGLVCLGPTLRLRGFGLLVSRQTQAPRWAKLSRPLTSSERASMGIAISGMVLVVVGAFVATATKAGVGWALVTALASGGAFGIAASLGWAWLRGHPSQDPIPFVPPPSSTLTGSAVRPILTLRATASARWVTLVFCLVLAGGLIGLGVRGWIIYGHVDLLWATTVIAAIFVAMAYSYWSMYIQADDTAVVIRFVVTRRFERRELVAIRIGSFVISYYGGSGRRVSFLRSDGSVLFTTIFYWWGKDGLEALASYLGIPIELAD